MKRAILFVFTAFFAHSALAADGVEEPVSERPEIGPYEAVEANLQDFLWLKRPIVVFADTPADPRFREQMGLLEDRIETLEARDVVIITDTDPSAPSELRLDLRPRGFMMVLIGKDGGVKLRKPFPWDVRELSRAIDKMPLRQQELRDSRRVDE
jgi:hypothetical protein